MSASHLLSFAIICTYATFILAETTTDKPLLKCYACNESLLHPHEGPITCNDEFFMPPEDEKDEAEHQKKLDAKVVTCGAGHNACFKTYTSNYQVLQGKKELVSRIKDEMLGCDYNKGSAAYAWDCYCRDEKCNSADLSHIC